MTSSTSWSGVLFDIDGTLLTDSSAHITYLMNAIAEATGVEHTFHLEEETPVVAGADVAGFTDCQLLEHLVPGTDPANQTLRTRIMGEYSKLFAQDMERGSLDPGTVVPGADEMLAKLRERRLPLGLSTGNASVVAYAKLRAVGLAATFSFGPELGFGDRWSSRTDAVRAALQGLKNLRASESNNVGQGAVALVGDTVADMQSARAHGLIPIGALTGAASGSALRLAGAQHILQSAAELSSIDRSPGATPVRNVETDQLN